MDVGWLRWSDLSDFLSSATHKYIIPPPQDLEEDHLFIYFCLKHENSLLQYNSAEWRNDDYVHHNYLKNWSLAVYSLGF
jgi:hypothetical protein